MDDLDPRGTEAQVVGFLETDREPHLRDREATRSWFFLEHAEPSSPPLSLTHFSKRRPSSNLLHDVEALGLEVCSPALCFKVYTPSIHGPPLCQGSTRLYRSAGDHGCSKQQLRGLICEYNTMKRCTFDPMGGPAKQCSLLPISVVPQPPLLSSPPPCIHSPSQRGSRSST